MQKHLTAEELIRKHTDEHWQQKCIDLLDVAQFLRYCIIKADYRVSDSISLAIAPSDAGNKMVRELGKSQGADKVPTKEAKLMCLLDFAYVDILVDPLKCDIDRLVDGISNQLRAKEILLPYAFGPKLYRHAADLFPDRRRYLGVSETLDLLKDMPIGVFQSGQWISGPFGLLRSAQARSFQATRRVPLQHCSDISCDVLHSVTLDTDWEAPINAQRHLARRYHEAISELPSEWSKFFAAVTDSDRNRYSDTTKVPLFALVGDGFSLTEKQILVAQMLDDSPADLRARAREVGRKAGTSSEIAASFDEAECLQFAMLSTDQKIWHAIDRAIFEEKILIPHGEVRKSVIYADRTYGVFHISAEASSLGVRSAGGTNLPLLRLQRLLGKLYPEGDATAVDEISWLLRHEPGTEVRGKFDEFVRTANPRTIVERLLLARKETASEACHELELDAASLQSTPLVDRILWKLGFNVEAQKFMHAEFWRLHDRLRHAAQSATVSTIIDYQHVREASVSYFVELEHILLDSLTYITWALTNDHVMDKKPFQFSESLHRQSSLALLQQCTTEPLNFSGASTLYPLVRGFRVLSDHLTALTKSPAVKQRPDGEYPTFYKGTSLQKFPFHHTVPFLDIVPDARQRIINALCEISTMLDSSGVSQARNDQLHYRTSVADLDSLLSTLEKVQAAVNRIEGMGFARDIYIHERTEYDRWGRGTIYMSNGRGSEILLGRPNYHSFLNMPELDVQQYIFSSAVFSEPSDMFRFAPLVDSEYKSMWADLPLRRLPAADRASVLQGLEQDIEQQERRLNSGEQ